MNLSMIVLLLLLLAIACAWAFTAYVARKVTLAFGPVREAAVVDGERICFRSFGEGPAIVFVHGLGGQMRNFDYLPLQELARTHRVVLIDRPGSGRSPRVDDGKAGIAAQADLVAGFIRTLRFPQPPVVVGHSLGGAISLALALNHPECVSRLALLAPLTHLELQVPAAFRALGIRSPLLRRLFARTLATPLAIVSGRKVLAAVFAPDAPPADFPKRGGGLLGLRPQAFYGASTDMNAIPRDLPSLQQRYGELKLPVSILFGRGDAVLGWQAHGQALTDKLPHARLELIEGGHMLPVSHPEATARFIREAAGDKARATQQPEPQALADAV